jgi:DNA-binding transcriptional ArsR family regulator/rhodanese-related sulfurtransferase
MVDTHREFKERLYAQFARIGKALGSPHRLEILELLAQGERSVDSLATETGLSLANASQHLQALRRAALIESRREGLFVYYRLADPAVFELCATIQKVARRRLADLESLVRAHFGDRSTPEPVRMQDLLARARSSDMIILDARPSSEYEAGHIAGAISVPVDELQRRLKHLPKSSQYVAYCRGPYCVYADQAVELLRASRRRARRMLGGFPQWRAAGYPIAHGSDAPTLRRGGPARRSPRPRRSMSVRRPS